MEKRDSQHQSNRNPGAGALFKSVSLFVSKGRRISGNQKENEENTRQKRVRKPGGNMSSMATALANSNKANVKLIESLRKQSHFNR